MLKGVVCPISSERIDSHVSRLTVFINVMLMMVFMINLSPIPLLIVTLDYGIRAFGYNNYSPLCFLSSFTIKSLGVNPKMADKAPKVFASRLGFTCAALGTVFILVSMPLASRSIIGFFAVLAILDSVFDLCVGCIIYNYFVFPFFEKNRSASSN